MFKKFVYVTGILDLALGIWIALPALRNPQPATFLSSIMLGAFLVFCGLVLMWAAGDIKARAPVVLWQGLVRYVAVITIAIGVSNGLVGRENLAFGIMDLVIATVYVVGIIKSLGLSPAKVVLGRVQ